VKWWAWLAVAWVGADVAIVLAWNIAKAKVQARDEPYRADADEAIALTWPSYTVGGER